MKLKWDSLQQSDSTNILAGQWGYVLGPYSFHAFVLFVIGRFQRFSMHGRCEYAS